MSLVKLNTARAHPLTRRRTINFSMNILKYSENLNILNSLNKYSIRKESELVLIQHEHQQSDKRHSSWVIEDEFNRCHYFSNSRSVQDKRS